MLEVSQPRGPCFKLNRRWHSDDLMERAVQNGRVGWYFRVRQPGKLRAGDPIELVDGATPAGQLPGCGPCTWTQAIKKPCAIWHFAGLERELARLGPEKAVTQISFPRKEGTRGKRGGGGVVYGCFKLQPCLGCSYE
jgi:hypothetical protein